MTWHRSGTTATGAVLLEAGSILAEGSVDDVWTLYLRGVEQAAEPVSTDLATAGGSFDDAIARPALRGQTILSADLPG